jgi:hypothetical protein
VRADGSRHGPVAAFGLGSVSGSMAAACVHVLCRPPAIARHLSEVAADHVIAHFVAMVFRAAAARQGQWAWPNRCSRHEHRTRSMSIGLGTGFRAEPCPAASEGRGGLARPPFAAALLGTSKR